MWYQETMRLLPPLLSALVFSVGCSEDSGDKPSGTGGASGSGGTGASSVLKAVIYDPDADELVVVAEGAMVGPRKVTRIDATGVTLTDAAGARRLLMEQGVP